MRGKKFKRFLFQKLSICVIPHSSSKTVTFNVCFFPLALLFTAFSFFSLWLVFKGASEADYRITKADNNILRGKIVYLSGKARESLDYLEMSKRTENEIKKIIGMNYDPGYSYKNYGGAGPDDSNAFREMLKKKSAETNANIVSESLDKIKAESRSRLTGYSEVTWYITNKYNMAKSMPKGWPVAGSITSPFGYRIHPLSFSYEFHSGVDISNEPGTRINATANGVVRHSGWAQGYGLSVLIDHGFGYSTLYGHMSEVAVKEGMTMKKGDMVGRMGSTGTSTGPHLHYEVWEQGLPKNPVKFMDYGKTASSDFVPAFENIFRN